MTPLRMRWEQTSPRPTSEGVLLKQGGQYIFETEDDGGGYGKRISV